MVMDPVSAVVEAVQYRDRRRACRRAGRRLEVGLSGIDREERRKLAVARAIRNLNRCPCHHGGKRKLRRAAGLRGDARSEQRHNLSRRHRTRQVAGAVHHRRRGRGIQIHPHHAVGRHGDRVGRGRALDRETAFGFAAVLTAVGSEPAMNVSGTVPETGVPFTRMVTWFAVAPLFAITTLCWPVALVYACA